ncbi:MAG: substrate-binding domain-containing protein [Janthinobacterium lividum]
MTMRSIGLSAVLLLLQFGVAEAGDVAIASAAAVRAPLEAAAALSEAEIGERLRMTYGTAGAVQDRVVGDGTIDIVVLPPARLDVLVRQGLVDPQTSPFGSVSLGLAVRTGAPRPSSRRRPTSRRLCLPRLPSASPIRDPAPRRDCSSPGSCVISASPTR